MTIAFAFKARLTSFSYSTIPGFGNPTALQQSCIELDDGRVR